MNDALGLLILVIANVPGLIILGTIVTRTIAQKISWYRGGTPRKKDALTPRERSDIYQDMDWWDREFRKLNGVPERAEEKPLSTSRLEWLNGASPVYDPKPPTTAELNRLNVDTVMKKGWA